MICIEYGIEYGKDVSMLLDSSLCNVSATSEDIEWCCVDLGASETHQVKRKVPSQAPERADGRCGQVGPMPSCEFLFVTLNPSQNKPYNTLYKKVSGQSNMYNF